MSSRSVTACSRPLSNVTARNGLPPVSNATRRVSRFRSSSSTHQLAIALTSCPISDSPNGPRLTVLPGIPRPISPRNRSSSFEAS